MRYLIFVISRICTNGYFMVTSQKCISQPFTKSRPLKVLLCHFWYLNVSFEFNFIRSLETCLSKWQFFHKIFYIKHDNIRIMKKLRMAKKIFQWPAFCQRPTYITLICNYKAAAICAHFRITFFANFQNCSKGIFGGGGV